MVGCPARGPVIFSEEKLARLDQVREHGGWLNKDELEYLQRLQAGGRRGDPLPAAPASREPFINGIGEDFEVRMARTAEHANVVVLFSHEQWPGIRFGHRFHRRTRPTDTNTFGSRKRSKTGLWLA